MVSCLTDISKQFSLFLSMREGGEIKKKREKNIHIVKTLLEPEVNTACCSELLLLFEGPCTSLPLSHLQLAFHTHLLLT